MDDEENQDNLINRNSSQAKKNRQGPFASSDDDHEDSEESGSEDEEEEDLDGEDGEEEEEESDSEEEDDEDAEEPPVENSAPSVSAADLIDCLSSDDERENCPICLNGFRDQVVGTPENCNHYFCLDCLVEWSKNANSCPVDRITFSCIHIRAHFGGEILKKVPILNKNEPIVVDDDPTNCEVCGRSDREDRLLLCDGCDAGYHMECLTPALNAVPVDEWFCPECAATNQPDEDQVSEEEVVSLLADVIPTTSRLRTNVVRTRAIARTRQSERVRASVNRIRTTARTSQNVPRYLLSSLLDETIEAVVAGLNTAVYTRDLTPRPATTRRKRRVGKKGKPKVSKGGRGVGKRRKRRVKKRKGRRFTNRKVSTSHKRIAKSLGICAPTRGTTLPRIQRGSEQTLGSMRSDIGAATLSVFGNPYDLDPFDSNEDINGGVSSPLTAKRRVLSRSALRSHRPVARPISVGMSRGGVAPLALSSVAVAEPVPDLLGSILSEQSILMMKSSDIRISRDGSLTAKKATTSQRKTSGEEDVMQASPSHSGSPTTTTFNNTWNPIKQQPTQPNFSPSGLYSICPSPPSSNSPHRLSGQSPLVSGGPNFRLQNAFTPRAVQVHSSASRLPSQPGEISYFNGSFHKPEHPSKNAQAKTPEIKYPTKPPALRLDISEFPRIPKMKREMDNDVSKRLEPSPNRKLDSDSSRPMMNQLTGRGDGNQLGRFSTAENTERNNQESQAHSRNTSGTSSQTESSSSKAPSYSNSSRNLDSSDAGGGGLRITISGDSTNSCRQFSPLSKDPFRTSDGKTPQKSSPSATVKKEKNEIYDPFEPTGSDSGSPSNSPERPATPPPSPPPPPFEIIRAPQSSGVKVGAFRSFKLTSHSSKVSASKLGPDFSGMSPTNREPEESPKSQVNASPTLPCFLKLEKEIKKEVIEEDAIDTPPFSRISCPLGLKITSDLKAGGTRGFHFDIEEELPVVSVKPDPDILPNRTSLQSTSLNRLVWDKETPHEPTSRTSETQKKKITIKEELKVGSSSKSRKRSQERDSRSAFLSVEEKVGSSSKSRKHSQEQDSRSASLSFEDKVGSSSKSRKISQERDSRSASLSAEDKVGLSSKSRKFPQEQDLRSVSLSVEDKVGLSSKSRKRSQERDSRSVSLSLEDKEGLSSKSRKRSQELDSRSVSLSVEDKEGLSSKSRKRSQELDSRSVSMSLEDKEGLSSKSRKLSQEQDSRSASMSFEDKVGSSLKSRKISQEQDMRSASLSVEDKEGLSSTLRKLSQEEDFRSASLSVEEKVGSSSTSRKLCQEQDLRSACLSEEKNKKTKSKSHKAKRARSDRSSSGSCERSKKKRQKERKKEKKRKRSESRERRRSRSSSHSSSSHRAYNSKKKKKKKRESRSDSPGYSASPEKERKKKHKSEKSCSNKEGSTKTKEKKKSKEDRGKQRSKSPQISKEITVHKAKDKTYFRDTEITRHIVLSPNNNEKTITCTVSFKTESPLITQETKSVLSLPKEEDDYDDYENDPFLYSKRKVSIKEEFASDLSDHSSDEKSKLEKIKLEPDSPPWSPSFLESLLPDDKSEDVPEPPSPLDVSPVNDFHSDSAVTSPPNSPKSIASDIPSPKIHSPHADSPEEAVKSASVLPVKKESDDLQWSPSHLDDLLLNELSDDVCSLDPDSPDDVDLEEAILMKGESDQKEATVINFSKTAVIPFLQDDDNSVETEAGNHINENTSQSKASEESKSDEPNENKLTTTSVTKSKPQIKRVTWNLHDKESEKETSDQSLSPPIYNTQQKKSWSSSEKPTDVKASSFKPSLFNETSTSATWSLPVKSTQDLESRGSWDAGSRSVTHTGNKPEDKDVVPTIDRLAVQSPDRPAKDASQMPSIATDKPPQVFPQTLPLLPLPPIFPTYAPLSEPTVPSMDQSIRTALSQTTKAGSLATITEPKIQASSKGGGKGKLKPNKEERVKNEEYMKKLHIQERAVEEVKLAIKPFYQKREITKDEYKDILRKAVQKICHSKSGEINPVKVVNLVKGYVDKYKHVRNKSRKSGGMDDHFLGHDSPL